jgi:hypothetical protein
VFFATVDPVHIISMLKLPSQTTITTKTCLKFKTGHHIIWGGSNHYLKQNLPSYL